MPDKCQAHDSCMNVFREDLEEIKDMLRDGKIVHKEHGWRIDFLEKQLVLLQNSAGAWGWRTQLLRLGFDLLGKGILIILAMAYYGYKAGWGQ